jgi:hypothetical protein
MMSHIDNGGVSQKLLSSSSSRCESCCTLGRAGDRPFNQKSGRIETMRTRDIVSRDSRKTVDLIIISLLLRLNWLVRSEHRLSSSGTSLILFVVRDDLRLNWNVEVEN